MKIEAGKIYRARAGHKVRVSPKQDDASYITCLHEKDGSVYTGFHNHYGADIYSGAEHDIIAEWSEQDDATQNQAAGPIRTETKRTLVRGVYGNLKLDDDAFSLWVTPISDIRATIATLTEIAEVYEENKK